MEDYIIKASAADSHIRTYAATTRSLVEHARQIHGLSPVAAAALGRLLTAGAIMGSYT
jgi:molecular chaperone Hsp33